MWIIDEDSGCFKVYTVVHMTHSTPCPQCGKYDDRVVTTDGVVFRDNKVLLIKRGNEPEYGKWALPGGYLDQDETAEEAVEREVEEETGLNAKVSHFINVYSDPKRDVKQVVSIAFLLVTDSKDILAADDALEARWFDTDAIPEDIAFDHREIIQDALRIVNG